MSHPTTTPSFSQIPNYGLYGEPIDSQDRLGVHLEELHERSKDAGWRIKPHFHGRLFQIICLLDGSVEVHLDTQMFTLNKCGVVTVPMGTVHEFIFTPEVQGFVVTLTNNVLNVIRQTQTVGFYEKVLHSPSAMELVPNEKPACQLQTYLSLMQDELTEERAGRSAALTMLSGLLLTFVTRRFETQRQRLLPRSPHARVLEQFKLRVDQKFRHHLRVKDYAADLNISTSTLNRVCRQHLNLSAKGFIAQRLIAEARRRLIYTRQPLEEISYQLGFTDPAYFSRVFNKAEGIPPGAYRLHAQQADLSHLKSSNRHK